MVVREMWGMWAVRVLRAVGCEGNKRIEGCVGCDGIEVNEGSEGNVGGEGNERIEGDVGGEGHVGCEGIEVNVGSEGIVGCYAHVTHSLILQANILDTDDGYHTYYTTNHTHHTYMYIFCGKTACASSKVYNPNQQPNTIVYGVLHMSSMCKPLVCQAKGCCRVACVLYELWKCVVVEEWY
jgi:hypothetical protein